MIDLNLEELERLCDAAISGPWLVDGKYPHNVYIRPRNENWPMASMCNRILGRDSNAAFIAASRTALPALIAEVRRLQHEAERAEAERDFAIANHITRKVCPPDRLCGMSWGVRRELDKCSACWRGAAHFSDEEDEEV